MTVNVKRHLDMISGLFASLVPPPASHGVRSIHRWNGVILPQRILQRICLLAVGEGASARFDAVQLLMAVARGLPLAVVRRCMRPQPSLYRDLSRGTAHVTDGEWMRYMAQMPWL